MNIFHFLLLMVGSVYLLGVFLWTSGALYLDAGRRSVWGRLLVLVWAAVFATTLILIKPFGTAVAIVTCMMACVIVWWRTQQPSNDRAWSQDFAALPEIKIEGDQVIVHNVRNTHYRSLKDFDCRWETREYDLKNLAHVDLLTFFWGSSWVCHPAAVFNFGNDDHLCFSIEVRYRVNESYDMLRGLFRQNELMYVVCDERDAILRRTKYAKSQDVYLYRLHMDTDQVREIFQEYVRETNALHATPRWYNTLYSNCTTSVYQQRNGKMSWDWRIVLNGSVDKMLYEWGQLYQGLPFDQLKKLSWINDRANSAQAASFSRQIREGLPGFGDLPDTKANG